MFSIVNIQSHLQRQITPGTLLRIRIRMGNFSWMSISIEPLIEHLQDRSSTNNGVSKQQGLCCYQCYSIKSLFVIIARRTKDVLKYSNTFRKLINNRLHENCVIKLCTTLNYLMTNGHIYSCL